jgi:alpha-tubulin suppressor-like RCC1 family protein
VPGVAVSFAVVSGGGSVSAAQVVTDAQGLAQVTATLGTAPGANSFGASVEGVAQGVTFTATGNPGSPAAITIVSGNAQSGTVGSALSAPLVVKVADSFGNAVPGATVSFAAVSGGGSVSAVQVVTGAEGLAQVTGTLGTAPGANSFSASVGGVAQGVAFTATATVGAANSITIVSGNAQSGTVGSALSAPLVVKVADSFGNAVPAATVSFAVVSGGGSVSAAEVVTGAEGLAQVTATLGTAPGENSFSASVAGISQGVTFAATATAGAPAAIAAVSGDGQGGTVGTALAAPMVVKVTDSFGNAVPGATVAWSRTSGSGSLAAESSVTDASGNASVGYTLGSTPGTETVSASVAGQSVGFSATATVGGVSTLGIRAGDGQSASPGSAVAIAPSVLATDSFGNPVPGAAVVFAVASGGGSVTVGEQTTDAHGVATVGSWTLGSSGEQKLTATSGSTSVVFTASPVSPRLATEPEELTTVTVTAGEVPTGLVFRVLDHAGAPVSGVPLTVQLPRGEETATPLVIGTNSEGRLTGEMIANAAGGPPTEAGTFQITVSGSLNGVTLSGSPQTVTLVVEPAGAAKLRYVTMPPASVAIGAEFSVSFKALDQFDNLVTGFSGPVTVALANNSNGAVLGGTLTRNAVNGVVSFDGLTVDRGGSGYTLQGNSGELAAALSSSFDVIAPVSSLIFGAAPSGGPRTGTADVTSNFYSIDASTGAATEIGAIGFGRVGAMDFHPGTGVLYATGQRLGSGVPVLITIDPMTGVGTEVGPTGAPGGISDLSFRSDGVLFGYEATPDLHRVHRFNISTGAASLVGASTLSFESGNGISFDAQDVLFHVNSSRAHRLNTLTGSASVIGDMTYPSECWGRVAAADLDRSTGRFVAALICGGTAALGTVDFVGGVVTLIGMSVPGLDGLAIRNASGSEPSPPPAQLSLAPAHEGPIVIDAGAPVAEDAPGVRLLGGLGSAIPAVTLNYVAVWNDGQTGFGLATDRNGEVSLQRLVERLGQVATTPGLIEVSVNGEGSGIAIGNSPLRFDIQVEAAAFTQLVVHAGNAQSAPPATAVTTPPAVRATDDFGNPVPGIAVIFSVESGGGSVTGAQATTDDGGIATVGSWTLGSSGEQRLRATAGDVFVEFTATVAADVPGLNVLVQPATTHTVGTTFSPAPVIRLLDSGGQPRSGVGVIACLIPVGFFDPIAGELRSQTASLSGGRAHRGGAHRGGSLLSLEDDEGQIDHPPIQPCGNFDGGELRAEASVQSRNGIAAQRAMTADSEAEGGPLMLSVFLDGETVRTTDNDGVIEFSGLTAGGSALPYVLMFFDNEFLYLGSTREFGLVPTADPPVIVATTVGLWNWFSDDGLPFGVAGETRTLLAWAADEWYNPKPYSGSITVSVNPAESVFPGENSSVTLTPNEGGIATTTFRSTSATYHTLNPSASGLTSKRWWAFTFPAAPSGAHSSLGGGGTVPADGVEAAEVLLELHDEFGNSAWWQPTEPNVEFAVTSWSGDGPAPDHDASHDGGSLVSARFRSTVPGTLVVGATVNGQVVPQTVTITFAPITVPVTTLSAGGSHNCALSDTRLLCWGGNHRGQLGDGTLEDRASPVEVLAGVTFQSVAAGGLSTGELAHTCALSTSGSAFCWGDGSSGQLGHGSFSPVNTPTAVAGGNTFLQLSAGMNFTCGLTESRSAYCWGANNLRQLGDGTTAFRNSPQPVATALRFVEISAGSRHACALSTAGDAYCWGDNSWGQLGDGTTTSRSTPVAVSGGLTFTSISAGDGYTCAVTTDAVIQCWGSNFVGRLGDGGTADRPVPAPVAGQLAFRSVSAGEWRVCALTTVGDPYCWGATSIVRRGSATTSLFGDRVPTLVPIGTASTIAAGGVHSCGRTTSGEIYCWGSNEWGQLGGGELGYSAEPLSLPGEPLFESLATGSAHSCGRDGDGSAFCWGLGREGQLGDGARADRLGPVAVAGELRFLKISGGGYGHTCGLSTQATIACWGFLPAVGSPSTPTVVTSPQLFQDVTSGGQHSCGIASDGSALCWGQNLHGQLGDGSATNRSTAVSVSSNLSFIDLSAGADHTCGIATADRAPAGTAYCWGRGTSGQLGNGSTTSATSPVAVQTTLEFSTISSGLWHTCALTEAGQAWCWGNNAWGQLGDGGTAQRTTPVAVSGNLSFVALSSGDYHSCGLAADGSLHCWGKNGYGQVGTMAATAIRVPTAAGGGTQFTAMSVGPNHNCGITASGATVCWGYRGYGTLGDGKVAHQQTPVFVGSLPEPGLSAAITAARTRAPAAMAPAQPMPSASGIQVDVTDPPPEN